MKNREFMPQARQERPAVTVEFEITQQARQHWNPCLRAMAPKAADEPATISILDPIGFDPWTGEGVTAKRISAILRNIGADKDVTVNINSPGGDLFEGFAIYNLLREHKGGVTVKVLGVAASAASIIAMAGDSIQIARAGFLMIHNTWVVAIGNRNDLRAVADQLEPFDEAMAEIYSARAGLDAAKVAKMMDAETWINGTAAVDQGFADALLPSDQVAEDKAAKASRTPAARADTVFARAGLPRSERRALIQELKQSTVTPGADGTGMPSAAGDVDGGTPSAAEVEVAAKNKEALDALRAFSVSDFGA